jgi:hypothetical protein
MERQAEPERVWLGWTERAYASIPLSPVMVGTAIAGVLLLAFGVSEFALGRHLLLSDIDEMPSLVRITVVHCLMAAYLPTAYIYLLRGYRGTLDRLRGDLDSSDAEVAELRARIGRYYTVTRGLAGLAGIGLVIWITRVTTPPLEDPWAWSALAQEVRWHRVLGLWNGPWVGIFILAATAEGRRLTGLAPRVSRVDLLDLQPLRPFTRQALLNAFLLAGLAGIALLTVGMVQSGFWVLVAGIWIFGAKLQEGGAERSRIDEIVAYRDVVEGVSAWPFDSSTAVRILLYLLIPLGSWAGGAIVERFVDSLLG